MKNTIETRPQRRIINFAIDGGTFLATPLTEAGAQSLLARGVVYDCGDGHDLHLTPDHNWDVLDVEAILTAIAEAETEDSRLVQAVRGIRFEGLRMANESRCRRWHPGGISDWTPERWFTATAGELGEAGNALKKHFRVQDGIANKNAPDRDIQTREQAIEKISAVTLEILREAKAKLLAADVEPLTIQEGK